MSADRRPLRPLRPLMAALAALLMWTGPAAQAESGVLPPIGTEIPMSVTAPDTPVEIDGELVRINFRGAIRVRVEADPDEHPHKQVHLNVLGFEVKGRSPDGVEVTLVQHDDEVAPPSILRDTQQFPPRLENLLNVHISATIERPGTAPLELVSANPMTLRNDDLRGFPPSGDLHRLQCAVGLAPPGSPISAATILEFPARIGGPAE